MKIGLISMLANVGTTLNSQGGGYGIIQTRMLRDNHPTDDVVVNPSPKDWKYFDILYICEGVNFVEGSFNIPGGPQEIHYEKMRAIADFKGELRYSNRVFDFNQFNKRLKIDATFPEAKYIRWYNTLLAHALQSRKAVIGDSHALSVWKPGYSLDFTAGRTLHGFLKRNTPEAITANSPWQPVLNEIYDEVILYFGNIDLRFHLMRQDNPKQATIDLFTRYVEFAKQFKNATLVNLLPVEHESRKIPGTGLYKKQPFFGTRGERMEIREVANKIMNESGLKTIQWPEEWIDEDGTKMLDILEQKSSVHLRPKNYPYLNEILNVSK
jgi:hypothetical protein